LQEGDEQRRKSHRREMVVFRGKLFSTQFRLMKYLFECLLAPWSRCRRNRAAPAAFQIGHRLVLIGPPYRQLSIRHTNFNHQGSGQGLRLKPIDSWLRR